MEGRARDGRGVNVWYGEKFKAAVSTKRRNTKTGLRDD